MALVKDAKVINHPFGNAAEIVRVKYDFSVDGGAAGSLTMLTAKSDVIVKVKYVVVRTACTSGGSATVAIGKTAGSELLGATAVASLTAGAVFGDVDGVKLAADGVVALTIATADLTAGVVEAVFEVLAY
jgi:hypothetical protein